MNPESSNEQAIKALQALNAQFQEMVMSLAQGQQELKALLLKKKKKMKKVLSHMYSTKALGPNGLPALFF